MAPGIGPWTGFHVDPDFAADATWDVGALVEVELWHSSKYSPCGTGVVEILRHGPRARLYECRYHAVEDPDFGYYALESEASQKPFLLRLAAGKGDDGEVLFKGQDVMPIYRWRVLRSGMYMAEKKKKTGLLTCQTAANKRQRTMGDQGGKRATGSDHVPGDRRRENPSNAHAPSGLPHGPEGGAPMYDLAVLSAARRLKRGAGGIPEGRVGRFLPLRSL